MLEEALALVRRIWAETKDIGYQGFKKAIVLFICVIMLYVIYAFIGHYAPWLHLEKPVPSPSS